MLPFLNINMSRKCHVWVQGCQTLEKQHQNGREAAPNRDLVGSASVNCENYIPVFLCFCPNRLQPLQISGTNFVKADSQTPHLSKCDKQVAKSITTEPFSFLTRDVLSVCGPGGGITASTSSGGCIKLLWQKSAVGLRLERFK